MQTDPSVENEAAKEEPISVTYEPLTPLGKESVDIVHILGALGVPKDGIQRIVLANLSFRILKDKEYRETVERVLGA